MSLLMDALRKAEADKKQADASDNSDGGRSPYTNNDGETLASVPTESLELDSGGADQAETIDLAKATAELEATRANSSAELSLALEPLGDSDEPSDTRASKSSEDSSRDETPSERTETSPAMPAAEQTAGTYTDPLAHILMGATNSHGEAADPLAGTPPPSTTSGIKESIASAHTVFEAGSSGPSRRAIAWATVLSGLIGCALLGAGFYYFQQSPKTPPLPSPRVAVDVERAIPKPLPVVPIEAEEVGGVIVDKAAESAALGAGDASAEVTQELPQAPKNLPIEPEVARPLVTNEESDAMPTADASTDAVAVQQTIGPEADESAASSTISRPAPPQMGVSFGQVQISRGDNAEIDRMMKDAYAAWSSGDYAAAKANYQQVLDRYPTKRDALLGMAALKLRDGETGVAHSMYRDVLKRDPHNPTATAAMLSIEGGQGQQATVSRLKMLRDQGADVGYINFSLGNLYAREGRWAHAQRAYFDALRNYPNNPDYNYNLAVALDRIGQREAARKYYERAVNLADTSNSGFDPAVAIARISAINAN